MEIIPRKGSLAQLSTSSDFFPPDSVFDFAFNIYFPENHGIFVEWLSANFRDEIHDLGHCALGGCDSSKDIHFWDDFIVGYTFRSFLTNSLAYSLNLGADFANIRTAGPDDKADGVFVSSTLEWLYKPGAHDVANSFAFGITPYFKYLKDFRSQSGTDYEAGGVIFNFFRIGTR